MRVVWPEKARDRKKLVAIKPPSPVEPDGQKTPRQIAGNAGVSFGLVCRNCIGSRFRQDLKLFFRENREVARRREDFRRYSGVFRRFKKPRKAAVFFESGGILGGKGRSPRILRIRESADTSAFRFSVPIIRLGNGTDFVPNYQGAGH